MSVGVRATAECEKFIYELPTSPCGFVSYAFRPVSGTTFLERAGSTESFARGHIG